jgi:hypothetical protein
MFGNQLEKRWRRHEKAATKRAGTKRRRRSQKDALARDPEGAIDHDDFRFHEGESSKPYNGEFQDAKRERLAPRGGSL